MRLSNAMAMGRVTVNEWLKGKLDGCALGMAANAVGIPQAYHCVREEWPWLHGRGLECPLCGRNRFIVSDETMFVIAHIFDVHVIRGHLTLDQLIDWVRSVEPPEEIETTFAGESTVEVWETVRPSHA